MGRKIKFRGLTKNMNTKEYEFVYGCYVFMIGIGITIFGLRKITTANKAQKKLLNQVKQNVSKNKKLNLNIGK